MKAKKLMLLIAFAGFGLYAGGAFAQGNEQQTETTPPPATEENAAATGTETEPYNETVTIDENAASTTSSSESTFAAQPEKKEKLRVYSGKHDGNNVISDPR